MESIGAFDAKTRLSELLERAGHGESFLITRHGHPIARLIPSNGHSAERTASAISRIKSMRGILKDMTVDDVMSARDEGRRF